MTDATLEERGIIPLLEHVSAVYARLRQIARRQQALVTSSDAGELLDVLSERQRLTAALSPLVGRISSMGERWDAAMGGLSEGHRARARELLAGVHRAAGEIAEIDARSTDVLKVRKQEARAAMTHTTKQAHMLSAYGGSESGPVTLGNARRLDKTDESA